MKKLLIIILVSIILSGCGQPKTNQKIEDKSKTKIEKPVDFDMVFKGMLDPDLEIRKTAVNEWERARISDDPKIQEKFKTKNKEIIIKLVNTVKSSDNKAAEYAMDSLVRLRHVEKEIVEAFLSALEDKRVEIRYGGLRGLDGLFGQMGKLVLLLYPG